MKKLDPTMLTVGASILVLMCAGPIGSGKKTPTCWQSARVTAIVRHKSKWHPHGHIKVDVLTATGSVAVTDEIGLHELDKYTRASGEPVISQVDLLNASSQLFCETLFLASKIGVTDAIAKTAPRSDHVLAAMLCVRGKYRYEHVRMLHEAYKSGWMFTELQGQPSNMTRGAM